MQILLFFFLLIFIIAIPIIFFILKVIGLAFRPKGRNRRSNTKNTQTTCNDSSNTKKVFDKNEGEYVDFEEVDD